MTQCSLQRPGGPPGLRGAVVLGVLSLTTAGDKVPPVGGWSTGGGEHDGQDQCPSCHEYSTRTMPCASSTGLLSPSLHSQPRLLGALGGDAGQSRATTLGTSSTPRECRNPSGAIA
jgi:hypothetical protein